MAYNFFNLGIIGTEIKRRLDMLKDITGTNKVASTDELNASIQTAINLNVDTGVAYIDAGDVTEWITKER